MSLATRCPSCGTVFRVVPDQLKVSEGWVRCGRCSEVFNAGQRVFDLERDGAPPGVQPLPPAATPDKTASPHLALATSAKTHVLARAEVADPSPAVARVGAALAPPSEAAPASMAQGDGRVEPTLLDAPASADVALDAPVEPAADAGLAMTAEPTPDFILRADRAARWRHPARRSALGVLALLLAALLGAQVALNHRDGLAAGWPASKPWLQAACNVLGCLVEAPRRIDSLSVDSSALVRVEGSPLHRMSLLVQNKAATVVRMPAIELTLTDAQGQILARRVLLAAELGNPSESLPARGESALQGSLELGEWRVAGYTVELFYP